MFFIQTFRTAYNKRVDGLGIAIFRIVYSLILFAEVCQLFYFRHLVYDSVPYLQEGPIDPSIPLFLWAVVVVMILFGAFTRIATFANYIFSLVFIGTITSYEYHMFYAWMGINFLLIFLPISNCLSIDSLRLKLKYSSTKFQLIPSKDVSSLAYIIPVFIGIGFVYFDSIFYKSTSHLWLNGLGMWLPASLPMVSHFHGVLLLNNELLMKCLGYLTFLFELTFIFLFWFKKFRLPLLIIGVGLHIGILIEFPIPWFALGVISIYLLMVPLNFWKKLMIRKARHPQLKFFYDAECPLCIRTKIVIEHFDIRTRIKFLSIQGNAGLENALSTISEHELYYNIHSIDRKGRVYSGIDTYLQVFKYIWFLKPMFYFIKVPGIYMLSKSVYNYVAVNRTTERCTDDNCGYSPPLRPLTDNKVKILNNLTLAELKSNALMFGLLILIIFQVNVTYNSALIVKWRKYFRIEETIVGSTLAGISGKLMYFSKSMFGITSHAVFMDDHFNSYNHIIAIVYEDSKGNEKYLPIIDKDGMPDKYIYGFNWVKWTFRVNSPHINDEQLKIGIRDFTAFWAKKNNVSLNNAVFRIKVKKIEIPTKWERDFLDRQMKNPWLDGGEVRWKNEKFVANIRDVESI